MAALDDILGNGGTYSSMTKPGPVSPTPQVQQEPTEPKEVELPEYVVMPTPAPMSGVTGLKTDATAIVGQAGEDPRVKISTPQPQKPQLPGIDAAKLVGKPGSTPTQELKELKKPRLSYVEMYKMLNPEKPETAEEKAKRMKREKSEAALSAVGDAISAFSNLWFTSQYAPSAYDPNKGMSAHTKARWEKLRQTREANRKAYADGYFRALAMDRAEEKEERNWTHTLERQKVEDKYRESKEQREEKKAEQGELMFQAKYALQLGKLTEQGYRNVIAEIKAGTIKELTEAQINRLNRVGSGSSGGGSHGDGSGHKGPSLQLEDKTLHFDNGKDYDRSVLKLAPQYGVATTTEVVTETDYKGRPKKKKTVKRSVYEIAADIEREAAKKAASNNQKTQPKESSNGTQSTPKKTTQTISSKKWSNTSNIKWS